MSREIKFRAWDGERMIPFEGLLDIPLHHLNGNGMLSLMEYAGFKDRNNKEIYEFDIVQPYYGGSPKYSPDIVVFTNGCFFLEKLSLSIHQWSEYDGVYIADLEVIGNKFDNPELLK